MGSLKQLAALNIHLLAVEASNTSQDSPESVRQKMFQHIFAKFTKLNLPQYLSFCVGEV